MGRYKFKNRKYPKDFQSVCDYIKDKKGVVVKLGHITSFMGHFNRTIFVHHNYDLTNNGLYALLHEVGHALQPPTAVGSNSYKNIDDDLNKREFEMGRFVNELNAWEIGLSIANKLKISLDKDDWISQKNEALLTYWPKNQNI
jgi:hypothetical protein|tara:strand:+ start:104 stop:532 length:429 start_codon:yes stop_codon:yes gene_type:complete